MACWDRREAHVATVLNNRSARAMQIYIRVLAIVHSDLSGNHNNDAVLDRCDVSRPSHVTSNDQRVHDVLEGKAGKRGAFCGWCRHINDATVQAGKRP
jgi:hypothetical protein